MKKWEFPPITEKMVNGVNKEVEEEKKTSKDEPRFVQLGLMNGEIIKIPFEDIECLQVFDISENHYFTSSLYLAALREVDPCDVAPIVDIKGRMAKVLNR